MWTIEIYWLVNFSTRICCVVITCPFYSWFIYSNPKNSNNWTNFRRLTYFVFFSVVHVLFYYFIIHILMELIQQKKQRIFKISIRPPHSCWMQWCICAMICFGMFGFEIEWYAECLLRAPFYRCFCVQSQRKCIARIKQRKTFNIPNRLLNTVPMLISYHRFICTRFMPHAHFIGIYRNWK